MTIKSILGLLALASCGGDDVSVLVAPAFEPSCRARSGAYSVQYQELSGDCGSFESEVVVVESAGGRSCTGSSETSLDGCSVRSEARCEEGEGFRWLTGQVLWNPDGSSGVGTFQITKSNRAGIVSCSSVYRVTFRREP
jgi:hypothetical protein